MEWPEKRRCFLEILPFFLMVGLSSAKAFDIDPMVQSGLLWIHSSFAPILQKAPLTLSETEMVHRALQNNFTLRVLRQEVSAAREALMRRRAHFDPTLFAQFSYRRVETFQRSAWITRFRERPPDFEALREAFERQLQGNTTPVITAWEPCVSIDGRLVNASTCQIPEEFSTREEFASIQSIFGPTETVQGALGLEKRWWIGAFTQVTINSTYRIKHFYALSGLETAVRVDDPFLLGSRFPWTAGLNVTVEFPLPWTKDWGSLGHRPSVEVRLAEKRLRERQFRLKAAQNQLIRNIHRGYWELLRLAAHVGLFREQATLLEAIDRKVQIRRRLGEATLYDLKQVEASLWQIREQLSRALSRYQQQANRLAELMAEPLSYLILPERPNAMMAIPPPPRMRGQIVHHPSLRALSLRVDQRKLEADHFRAQLRPDLKLRVTFSMSQSDAVAGYRTFGRALNNLFDPDSSSLFVSLTFRWPWGNWIRKHRFAKAVAAYQRDRYHFQYETVQRQQDLHSAFVELRSRYDRYRLALEEAKIAEETYRRVTKMADQGELTQFVRLRKLADQLAARLRALDALVDYRQAYIDWLAAQGKFADHPGRAR